MMHRATAVGVVLALAMAASACGGDDDVSGGTTATTARAAAASARAITTSGPLGAGAYRDETFGPLLSFDVPASGWYAGQPMAGFLGVNQYPAHEDNYVIVFRPAQVYAEPYPTKAALPADVGQWLHDRRAFTAGPITEATVGGRAARRFDATVSAPERRCDIGARTDVGCTVLAPVPDNEDYRFGAGDKVRFWVLDVDGPVIVSASSRAADFDAFAPEAADLVASLRFG